MNSTNLRRRGVLRWCTLAIAALLLPLLTPLLATAAEPGDTVHIGDKVGYGGTGLFPIWLDSPTSGEPDYWAYCIEHSVTARTGVDGQVGDADSFLGDNHFNDPAARSKVLWILANSYPAISLADFGDRAGVPGISQNDAIEATQYAIWRYTDLTWDGVWAHETPDSEAAYWHLVDGANASSGLTPADLAVEVSVSAPTGGQIAGTLVGPFTVSTNQSGVSVSVDPAVSVTDASGTAIDTDAVGDGQELYLDLRGVTTAGSATVSASAPGSSATGLVVSVPTSSGAPPTESAHAQSIILVTPATAGASATANVTWAAAQAPSGVFHIMKAVQGDASARVPASAEFTVEATWDGGSETFTVPYDGAWVSSPSIPLGVEVSIAEVAVPDIPGVEWTGWTIMCLPGGGDTPEWRVLPPDSGVPATITLRSDTSFYCTLTNDTAIAQPSIGTSLVDAADGDRVLPWNGGTAIDTVSYENLTAGVEYTVAGELVRRADQSPTGITGSITFTAAEANGSVDIVFEVPEGFAGETLVAFERLYEGDRADGDPIAVHEDPNDVDQTIVIESAPDRTDPTDPVEESDPVDDDPVDDEVLDDDVDENAESDDGELASAGAPFGGGLLFAVLLCIGAGLALIRQARRV